MHTHHDDNPSISLTANTDIPDPTDDTHDVDFISKVAPPGRPSISLWRGILLVLCVGVSWTAAGQFAKSASTHSKFTAATFMLYLSTSTKSLLFPTLLLTRRIFHIPHAGLLVPLSRDSLERQPAEHQGLLQKIKFVMAREAKPVPLPRFFRAALVLFVLYLGANWLFLKAVWFESAAVVSAVAAITPAFVYALSCAPFLLATPFRLHKAFAVLLAIGGTASFYSGATLEHDGSKATVGILMAIGSSLCAALYKVFLKHVLGDGGAGQVALILSLIGVANILTVWVVVLVFDITGIEVFSSHPPWFDLCLSALMSLIFNFLVNISVCYTSPLFVSVGSLIGIPMSALVDVYLRGETFTLLDITGTILICVSFLILVGPWS